MGLAATNVWYLPPPKRCKLYFLDGKPYQPASGATRVSSPHRQSGLGRALLVCSARGMYRAGPRAGSPTGGVRPKLDDADDDLPTGYPTNALAAPRYGRARAKVKYRGSTMVYRILPVVVLVTIPTIPFAAAQQQAPYTGAPQAQPLYPMNRAPQAQPHIQMTSPQQPAYMGQQQPYQPLGQPPPMGLQRPYMEQSRPYMEQQRQPYDSRGRIWASRGRTGT